VSNSFSTKCELIITQGLAITEDQVTRFEEAKRNQLVHIVRPVYIKQCGSAVEYEMERASRVLRN